MRHNLTSKTLKYNFNELRKIIGNVIVLIVFIIPIFLSVNWVQAVIQGSDNRKIIVADILKPSYTEIYPFEEPLISVTFDDGWESIYSNGLEVFDRYKIRTTQYILSGTFDEINYFSIEQVKSLQNLGHDIGSHTIDHPNLTGLNDAELVRQIKQSKTDLEGLFGPVVDFASPLSAFNERTVSVISDYYRSHRNTFSDTSTVNHMDVNVKDYFDPYNIYAFSVTKHTTISELKMLVQYAKKANGWLVLNYHQIDDSDMTYSITKDTLEEHMLYLSLTDVKIPTVREVLDEVL